MMKEISRILYSHEASSHFGAHYVVSGGNYVVLVSDEEAKGTTNTRRHDLAVEIRKTVERFIQEHPIPRHYWLFLTPEVILRAFLNYLNATSNL